MLAPGASGETGTVTNFPVFVRKKMGKFVTPYFPNKF
jgi:hypothetical protein